MKLSFIGIGCKIGCVLIQELTEKGQLVVAGRVSLLCILGLLRTS